MLLMNWPDPAANITITAPTDDGSNANDHDQQPPTTADIATKVVASSEENGLR